VLSALRHRAAELGDQAQFLQSRTYGEALERVRERISVCQPTTWAADRFVRSKPAIDVLPPRGFCTDRAEFDEWAKRRMIQPLAGLRRLTDLDEVVEQQHRLGQAAP
jgi:deoxyribodipyrimidine photolyase-related protein